MKIIPTKKNLRPYQTTLMLQDQHCYYDGKYILNDTRRHNPEHVGQYKFNLKTLRRSS